MTSTIQFINEQIQSSGEAWKPDHIRATECVKLEKCIRRGLSLYKLFTTVDDMWSRQVQSGEAEYDPAMARALHAAYSWWIKPCPQVISEAAKFEGELYTVEGADDLRKAYRDVKNVLVTDIEGLIASMVKARAA